MTDTLSAGGCGSGGPMSANVTRWVRPRSMTQASGMPRARAPAVRADCSATMSRQSRQRLAPRAVRRDSSPCLLLLSATVRLARLAKASRSTRATPTPNRPIVRRAGPCAISSKPCTMGRLRRSADRGRRSARTVRAACASAKVRSGCSRPSAKNTLALAARAFSVSGRTAHRSTGPSTNGCGIRISGGNTPAISFRVS